MLQLAARADKPQNLSTPDQVESDSRHEQVPSDVMTHLFAAAAALSPHNGETQGAGLDSIDTDLMGHKSSGLENLADRGCSVSLATLRRIIAHLTEELTGSAPTSNKQARPFQRSLGHALCLRSGLRRGITCMTASADGTPHSFRKADIITYIAA